MKRMIFSALALFVFAGAANAQESLVDDVLNSCEADITGYCPQVTPGEGRLLHCMAAHEDKISGQCQYALYRAATILEQMSAALAHLINECGEDADKLCRDVAMGEGRILACLDDNSEMVSMACKAAISDTIGE